MCGYCSIDTAGNHKYRCPLPKNNYQTNYSYEILFSEYAAEDIYMAELGMNEYNKQLLMIDKKND